MIREVQENPEEYRSQQPKRERIVGSVRYCQKIKQTQQSEVFIQLDSEEVMSDFDGNSFYGG